MAGIYASLTLAAFFSSIIQLQGMIVPGGFKKRPGDVRRIRIGMSS